MQIIKVKYNPEFIAIGVGMLDKVKNAKIGSIVPIYEVVDTVNTGEFFIKLSNYGKNKNSLLFESEDQSIGSSNPCLKISGQGEDFEIKALNNLGRKFLQFLKGDFKFCDKVEYGKNSIKGKLKPARKNVSEYQRLRLKSHLDILRTIAFKFEPTEKPFIPYAGLFGMFSYDFIDQLEDLPKNLQDDLNDADYEMYFLDNLFVIDHKENKTYIVANALVMDNKQEKLYNECLKTIESYKKDLKKKETKIKKCKKKPFQQTTDTTKEEFISIADNIKKHILEGDILQASISKAITANYNAEPFDIYNKLKQTSSQFNFYINSENGILIGSTPGINLSVKGDVEKAVEMKIIGSNRPRGLVNNTIDKNLDNKYEAELKIDNKAITQHSMLVDLTRNNIAKISETGSRHVSPLSAIEKRPDKQYLVSNVKGILKKDLDALHAFFSTIDMQTGISKIIAIKLLRQYEKTKRNFYSGSSCYLTPSGDFISTIITKAMKLKNNKAHFRAEARVFQDSSSESKFQETDNKAKKYIDVIKLAGGLK